MSMAFTDLATDLEAMLGNAANRFTAPSQGDFRRHLELAAADLARYRPRTKQGQITLQAEVSEYPLPADTVFFTASDWGRKERRTRQPWDRNWPGRLPVAREVESESGTRLLFLDPAPTAAQIADLGSAYHFFYVAEHVVGDDAANTTVQTKDRHLLLVRAVVFALLELSNDHSSAPVSLGDKVGSGPKNGTPPALAETWFKAFERMATA